MFRGKIWYYSAFLLLIIFIASLNLYAVYEEKLEGRLDDSGSERGCRSGRYVVPNYVHVVRLGRAEVSFVEAVCLLAAVKHQRPERLLLHVEAAPTGRHWEAVRAAAGPALRVLRLAAPRSVLGQPLSAPWARFHAADVLRLRILRTYGGIYLDNDSYLVRSLDTFRKYEMTLGWIPGKFIQNQVIVAQKDARFLKEWLLSYKSNYNASSWYYNAGEYPTKILQNAPHLVHAAGNLFGTYGLVRKIFEKNWSGWRGYYAVHLMIRHQYLLRNISRKATFPVKFNEVNIHNYPNAFRQMVYEVYPVSGKT